MRWVWGQCVDGINGNKVLGQPTSTQLPQQVLIVQLLERPAGMGGGGIRVESFTSYIWGIPLPSKVEVCHSDRGWVGGWWRGGVQFYKSMQVPIAAEASLYRSSRLHFGLNALILRHI